jgi:two-component system nitrate/nitrite response regulator NarL
MPRMERCSECGQTIRDLNAITAREVQVIRFVCAGESNLAISEELRIAEASVKQYLVVIFRKLKIHSRLSLAFWATHEGKAIVYPPDYLGEEKT